MPHVDEGLLHAYLDGALDALAEAGALPPGTTRASIDAHLAVCADCRALLETERTIRTRAGAVLDAAAPVIDVPPFDELFGARHTRPPRRRVWPLAWAASLLLAVGAGWWGNLLFQQQRGSLVMDEEVTAPAAPSADVVQESQRALEPAAETPPPASAPAAPPVSGMATGTELRASDALSRRAAERPNREQAAADPRPRDLAATAQQARPEVAGAEGARHAEDTRRVAPDTGRNARIALEFRAGAVVGAGVRDSVAPFARRDRAAAAAAAPVTTPAPPPPSAAQQRVAGGAASLVDVDATAEAFRGNLAELDGGHVPLSTGAPAGLPLLQLDGGSSPNVQRGAIVGVDLARITQRAPHGVAVELIIWRQTPVALNEVVVTGPAAPRRESDSAANRNQRLRAAAEVAQKARADRASFAHSVIDGRVLTDGRRELLLRSADGAFFVALRAAVSDTELRALAGRLVELPRE